MTDDDSRQLGGPSAQWIVILIGVIFTVILLVGLTMAALNIDQGNTCSDNPSPSPSPSSP